jgi:hypothetical protein
MAKNAQPASLRATVGVLGLCMALGVLAAAYRHTMERAHRADQASRAARAELVAGGDRPEQAALSPASGPAHPPAPAIMEAGAFGSLSGQLVPADGGAVVHVYRRDGSASKYAFADPHSGSFTLPELPVDVYRVVVRPENPALEARVIEDVVVPWGNEGDLGAIDLRPAAERDAIDPSSEAVEGDGAANDGAANDGATGSSESQGEIFAEEGATLGD